MQDSSANRFDATPINAPVFDGQYADFDFLQREYVELPQSLVQGLQSWPSFSFAGWVHFKTVRWQQQGLPYARASRRAAICNE